jgi:hypothetical protein
MKHKNKKNTKKYKTPEWQKKYLIRDVIDVFIRLLKSGSV